MVTFLKYAALITAFSLISAAIARDLDQDEALRLTRAGVIRPFEEILPIALGRYPDSKLLEAELEQEKGTYLYEIELLTVEGVVRELELDARNGQILKDREDD